MTTTTPRPETADRPHAAAKRYIYAWGDGGAEGTPRCATSWAAREPASPR